MTSPNPYYNHLGEHEKTFSNTTLGFWIYLMTDCIVFAVLFATYAVLHNHTNGGLPASQLFNLSSALQETLVLLTSSFTCGLALLSAYNNQIKRAIAWFFVTSLLGIAFLTIELTEFINLVQSGNSWQLSAFLSSFFLLLTTHGLHVAFGLLWMFVVICEIKYRGFTATCLRQITCFSMFWHFLDLIWVFIFTFVYLMEVII